MVVFWESIFYKTLLCTLLMTTDPLSVSPENHVIPKKFLHILNPPPLRDKKMTGALTKTQKRKGSVAYIFR